MLTSLQLIDSELVELNYERYRHPSKLIRRRLHCVYAKAKMGFSNEQIAALFCVHAHTVGQYVSQYKRGGLPLLLTHNYGTNQSELEVHSEAILADFADRPPRTVAEAKERIFNLTQIERSPTRIEAFLKRHGLKYRKLGSIPSKADPDKQAKWLEEQFQPHLQEAQQGKRHLLFMDAAHFVLGAFLCSVWAAVRCFIRSSAGRNRINVLGAVHAISKQLIFTHNTDYINAQTIIDFLHQLKQELSDLPITIVLDNARYQHCKAVKQVAQTLEITLLFLPPYSPNLNLIERVWKLAKKKVLYAKYFDSVPKFHLAVTSFFENSNHLYHKELHNIINLKFQTFDNSRIYQV